MPPIHVRVFLSSPSDMAAERSAATEVLDGLPREAAWRGLVTIEVVSWDAPLAPASMVATLPPQQSVSRVLPRPSECELTVVILWGRMGTPLDGERKADGSQYLSGTEWEFHDAVSHDRAVLLYRKTAEILISITDASLSERRRQAQLVDEFFAGFQNPDGSFRRSYSTFDTLQQFRAMLKANVELELRLLTDRVPRSQRRASKATTEPAAAPHPSSRLDIPAVPQQRFWEALYTSALDAVAQMHSRTSFNGHRVASSSWAPG